MTWPRALKKMSTIGFMGVPKFQMVALKSSYLKSGITVAVKQSD